MDDVDWSELSVDVFLAKNGGHVTVYKLYTYKNYVVPIILA